MPDHAETGLLKVKALAAALPAHLAQLDLARTKVILGSHSEPYQCLESSALLTRSILRELVSIPLKGLEIRTASPEILQDIVMLKQFPSLQVTVFLPTDSQAVLDDFHPYSPSLTSRIDLIQQLQDWGIAVTVGLAPLLPIQDIDKFADLLKGFGCNLGVHILQKSPMSTSPSQRKLQTAAKEYGWSGPEYLETVIKLRKRLPGLRTLDLI